jgi:hypothetical protein
MHSFTAENAESAEMSEKDLFDRVTENIIENIIGAAIEVHRQGAQARHYSGCEWFT